MFRLPYKLCSDMNACLDIVAETANIGTFLVAKRHLAYAEDEAYRSGFSSLSLLEDGFDSSFVGFNFKSFCPFYETFKSRLDQMTSAGIILRIVDNFFHFKSNQKKMEIGPQVLTMEHLAVGFLICLIPLALSIVAFVGELLIDFVRRKNFKRSNLTQVGWNIN